MIIDGKKLAADTLARAKARAIELPCPPRLAIVVASETPATASYLKAKQRAAEAAGCVLDIVRLPEAVSAVELRLAIDAAEADALVVQLPLPKAINAKEICDAIPLAKDADVLSTLSRMRFEADEPDALLPPVAGALGDILRYGLIEVPGKRAVVVGDGWLVGKPCATWLTHQGTDVLHLQGPGSDLSILTLADIVVSGAGAPHLITPGLLKKGVALVDAGTSEVGGKLAGDAHPDCAALCSLFTPVPGGVGPVAVAKLFENVVALAERTTDS